jgi:hypothetical protein
MPLALSITDKMRGDVNEVVQAEVRLPPPNLVRSHSVVPFLFLKNETAIILLFAEIAICIFVVTAW